MGEATRLVDAYFADRSARVALKTLADHADGVLVSDETVSDFQLRRGMSRTCDYRQRATMSVRSCLSGSLASCASFPPKIPSWSPIAVISRPTPTPLSNGQF